MLAQICEHKLPIGSPCGRAIGANQYGVSAPRPLGRGLAWSIGTRAQTSCGVQTLARTEATRCGARRHRAGRSPERIVEAAHVERTLFYFPGDDLLSDSPDPWT